MNETQFGAFIPPISPLDPQSPEGSSLVSTRPQFLTPGIYPFSPGAQEVWGGQWSPPNLKDAIAGVMWTARRIFSETQRRERRWNVALVAMKDKVDTLTHEVVGLKGEIQRLQQCRVYVVPLTTLTPSFRMVQQIPVTIEGDGEDFTATFVEANVSASGETEADAIANFKDSLLSSYEVLENLPPTQLGPLPARQWEILQNVVKRTD
jgi:hypothetical protein